MDRHLKKVAASTLALALGCSVFGATSAQAVVDRPVYMDEVTPGINLSQLLLSGDEVTGKTWQGIPDGMGGVKNKDGSISVFVNHELANSDAFVGKTEQSYGSFGSTISKVTVNSSGTTVSKLEDAIKTVAYYDYEDGKFGTNPGAPEDAEGTDSFGSALHTASINRLCSATMVTGDFATSVNEYVSRKRTIQVTVKVKGKSKKVPKVITEYQKPNGQWSTTKTMRPVTYGETNPVFITGEEGGDESRIFALNTATGELVQLPALGLGATENISVADSATTGMKTVAMVGEDGDVTDSQLYMFSGTKAKTGTWYQKAGLTGGKRYVANILNSGASVANDVAVRTALATKTISSATRGSVNAVTSTKIKIADGVATVTVTAHPFVAGDTVSIAGLTNAQKDGVDISDVTIVSTTATTYTFQTDGVDEAEVANTVVVATPSANRVLVTTGAVHGLSEGDRVNIVGVADLTGRYTVTSVPTTSKFTVETTATADKTFTTDGTSLVNELMEVQFKTVATNIAGDSQQTVSKLRGTEFSRIEDGEFNPANPNEYFFITTQSDSDGTGVTGVKEAAAGSAPARDGGALWKLTFDDVANPTSGATLELVLNGTEAPTFPTVSTIKLNKPDNLTFSADGTVVFIQEDPGGNDHVARLLALEVSSKKLANVAEFDNNMFGYSGSSANNDQYVTNDEESSGIFELTSLLTGGTGSTFMFNAQVHPVGASGGTSYGNDLLKARATAILRPDLLDARKTASFEFTDATVSTTNKDLTMTLSGVTETADADGLQDIGGNVIAPNDIISISGVSRATNGTYAVKGYSAVGGVYKITVTLDTTKSPWTSAGALADGAGTILMADTDKDVELKDAIIEGGGLYTFKVTSLSQLFTAVQ